MPIGLSDCCTHTHGSPTWQRQHDLAVVLGHLRIAFLRPRGTAHPPRPRITNARGDFCRQTKMHILAQTIAPTAPRAGVAELADGGRACRCPRSSDPRRLTRFRHAWLDVFLPYPSRLCGRRPRERRSSALNTRKAGTHGWLTCAHRSLLPPMWRVQDTAVECWMWQMAARGTLVAMVNSRAI